MRVSSIERLMDTKDSDGYYYVPDQIFLGMLGSDTDPVLLAKMMNKNERLCWLSTEATAGMLIWLASTHKDKFTEFVEAYHDKKQLKRCISKAPKILESLDVPEVLNSILAKKREKAQKNNILLLAGSAEDGRILGKPKLNGSNSKLPTVVTVWNRIAKQSYDSVVVSRDSAIVDRYSMEDNQLRLFVAKDKKTKFWDDRNPHKLVLKYDKTLGAVTAKLFKNTKGIKFGVDPKYVEVKDYIFNPIKAKELTLLGYNDHVPNMNCVERDEYYDQF